MRQVHWLDLLVDGTLREPVVAPDEVRPTDAYGAWPGEVNLIYDEKTDMVFSVSTPEDGVIVREVVAETLDQYAPEEL